nr:hypothetical protein [Tanacetum cinerariifolium]
TFSRKLFVGVEDLNYLVSSSQGWLVEDLDNYHLKEPHCSTLCLTQLRMFQEVLYFSYTLERVYVVPAAEIQLIINHVDIALVSGVDIIIEGLDGDDDDDDYDKESIISTNTDIFETPSSDAITTSPPILPIEDPEDSLIMGNEELSTIPKKESDKFIMSSVEDLVSILRGDDDEINVLDCEDSYYDSEGDILYLDSLLNDDLVHHDPSIPAMSVTSILEGNKSPAGMKTCQQKQNTLAAGMTIPNRAFASLLYKKL